MATLQELLGYYEILRVQFPGAQLQASTLETYFAALHAAQPPLPTITQEIGDTWIQGVASDPRKMAEMRVLTRVMASCFAEGTSCFSHRILDSMELKYIK